MGSYAGVIITITIITSTIITITIVITILLLLLLFLLLLLLHFCKVIPNWTLSVEEAVVLSQNWSRSSANTHGLLPAASTRGLAR